MHYTCKQLYYNILTWVLSQLYSNMQLWYKCDCGDSNREDNVFDRVLVGVKPIKLYCNNISSVRQIAEMKQTNAVTCLWYKHIDKHSYNRNNSETLVQLIDHVKTFDLLSRMLCMYSFATV